MKKRIKLTALCLCFLLLCPLFAGCSGSGEVLMTLADKSITVNQYQLLLSRMKGTLATYGYKVNDEGFWRTVITADGMTYDDYFSTAILEEASRYLIAEYLFDRNGLILDEDTEGQIDEMLNKMVDHAGSKTALNTVLKDYGVNYDMLRRIYIIEAKTALLKEHLYGADCEKIDTAQKEAYLQEHYVAFGQIFLASYYYMTDTDEFGDTVYYTDDKHTAIAYDQVNGETLIDEFGKTVTDIFGAPVYYNEAGRVAYDTEKGVVSYITDQDGDQVAASYDKDTLAALYEEAEQYAAETSKNIDLFRDYAALYDESEGEGKHNYLYSGADYYGAQDESFAYLDEIAETLEKLEVGETALVESSFGYHVVCKYELESGIYEEKEQEDVFADFYEGLVNMLFEKECAVYEDVVTLDSDALEEAPTISEVAVNTLY